MAVEDVEALAYVLGPSSPYTDLGMPEKLKIVEKIRYVRAGIVQMQSRAIAGDRRAFAEHSEDEAWRLTNPTRFHQYVFNYEGPQLVPVLSDEEYEKAKATEIPKVKHRATTAVRA
ncbi:hypothetical protein PUNSTDRAFT_113573 [Punctularia strigosozonata HHB-11173 SS5]|uniref:uncharacterized protein n=1 Tax=Punctularia strigosozonata (strain HHB-11173) TaxID=741275 RepID=UPI00044170AF|nr:uncharacterized protein PUNSTDRAFT_113573 [Punctularia strigosozonata HHB-11173 SS5]EIN09028.1 hypothetical protein PUNSTDRAFT_113573 [Punctularia strigosozonata HHB-11173 SS5]